MSSLYEVRFRKFVPFYEVRLRNRIKNGKKSDFALINMPKKNITKDTAQTEIASVEFKQKILKFFKGIEMKNLLIIILVVLAVFGMYGSWYFYAKYQSIKVASNLESQQEVEVLVLAVGKLIELPQDETPTIATISDKEKLKDQLFFKTGENGDKLLTYTRAMKAILYRPSINKIINVASIAANQP